MSLSNSYSLKIVSSKDQRPCFICGKLSASVFDAPDDFFFICLSHTKDAGFCTSSSIAAGTGEESEIEKLKKEISELKAKQDKPEAKNTQEVKDTKDSKIAADKKDNTPAKMDGPRIYKLHRSILFLREQEKSKKEKLNLLKTLK